MSDWKSAADNQQSEIPLSPWGQLMFRFGQTQHDDDTMKGALRFRPVGNIHPGAFFSSDTFSSASIITVFIFAICLVVVAVFWWKVPRFRARINMTIAPSVVSESDVYELAKMNISSDAVIGLLWRNPQMGVALIRSKDWQERDIRKLWERVQKTTERPDGDLIPCAELIYEIRGARPDIFDNDAMSEIRRKLYLAFFHWSRNAQEKNAVLYYAGISLGIVEHQRTIATLDSQTQSKVIQKINTIEGLAYPKSDAEKGTGVILLK